MRDLIARLQLAHQIWARLEHAEVASIARAWLIGGNPLLGDDTPVTVIREDRGREVTAAVTEFIEGA